MKKPPVPSPAFILAAIALFVALGGTSYAITRIDRNSVSSRHIMNNSVEGADIVGGGGRTGTIKNRDVNKLLAIAKAFATVKATGGGTVPRIINAGGGQTKASNVSVTAGPGIAEYTVTFNADPGVGGYQGVGSFDDVAVLVTPRSSSGGARSHAEVIASQSTANSNQIRVKVHTSRTYDGNAQEADFSVAVYINK